MMLNNSKILEIKSCQSDVGLGCEFQSSLLSALVLAEVGARQFVELLELIDDGKVAGKDTLDLAGDA